MSLEEKLARNAELGADEIEKVLKGEKGITDKSNLAMQAVKEHNKFIATKRVHESLKFATGRSISADATELKTYLRRHMPEYIEVKKIEK